MSTTNEPTTKPEAAYHVECSLKEYHRRRSEVKIDA